MLEYGGCHLLIAAVILLIFMSSQSALAKLCCDQDCRQPISYGRTVERHITRDLGFLSYPASAIVMVYAKRAHFNDDGEFWEAEIQGKRGLIRPSAINELTFKCNPELVGEKVDEPQETQHSASPEVEVTPTPSPAFTFPESEDTVYTDSYKVDGDIRSEHAGGGSEINVDHRDEKTQDTGSGENTGGSAGTSTDHTDEEKPLKEQDAVENDDTDSREKKSDSLGEGEGSRVTSEEDGGVSEDSVTGVKAEEEGKAGQEALTENERRLKAYDEYQRKEMEKMQQHGLGEGEGLEPEKEEEEEGDEGMAYEESEEEAEGEDEDEEEDASKQMEGEVEMEDEVREKDDAVKEMEDDYQSYNEGWEHQEREKNERLVREERERLEREQREKEEKERREREEKERQAKEEKERQEREEKERQAREEKEHQAREEKEHQEREEKERQEKEERERQEREEKERRERERQAREEKERQEKEERERQEREEKERQEKEERERQEREEKERQVREEKERQEREEKERQEKDEKERQEREGERHQEGEEEERDRLEREKKEKEERERFVREEREQLEKEQKKKQERERQEIEERERLVREARERQEREERERVGREARERLEREEKERLVREARERQEREERERQERGEKELLEREQEREEEVKELENVEREKEQFEEQKYQEEEGGSQLGTEREESEVEQESEEPEEKNEEHHRSFDDTAADEHQIRLPVPPTEATPTEDSPPTPPIFVENMSAYPCKCDVGEVPPPVYNCRDEYIPPPGSEGNFLQTFRVQMRDFILDSLPTEWSNWVCSNRPMVGIMLTSSIFVSLMIPLLFLYCQSCSSNRKKNKRVIAALASRREAETKLKEKEGESGALEKKAREATEAYHRLAEDLNLMTSERDKVIQEKRNLEVHCQTINENLAQTKEKVDQYLRDSEYHNSQIANLQQQQAAILTDKDHVMEQNVQLSATLSELQRTVQELEAQKDQLEHDKYSAQTSLEQLEAEHKKVLEDFQLEKDKTLMLESDLQTTGNSLETELRKVVERDEELRVLRDCLQQVTEQAASQVERRGVEGEGEGEVEEGDEGNDREEISEEDCQKRKEAQLQKIQSMLDTTKVQVQLHEAEKERDDYHTQLQLKLEELEKRDNENKELKVKVSFLEEQMKKTSEELRKSEIKMSGITEYFQQKEWHLHSKLEAGEQTRRQFETYVNEAVEKDRARAAEREQEKRELENLRAQMKDIESSYIGQAKNHEKRAEDSASQLRRAEQELRQTHREITMCRKRIAELENAQSSSVMVRPIPQGSNIPPQRPRPPSTGPISRPPPSHGSLPPSTSRPISAPRLDPPRTSSPSGKMEGPSSFVPTSGVLNTSQPIASASGRPDLPPRPRSRDGYYPERRLNTSSHPGELGRGNMLGNRSFAGPGQRPLQTPPPSNHMPPARPGAPPPFLGAPHRRAPFGDPRGGGPYPPMRPQGPSYPMPRYGGPRHPQPLRMDEPSRAQVPQGRVPVNSSTGPPPGPISHGNPLPRPPAVQGKTPQINPDV